MIWATAISVTNSLRLVDHTDQSSFIIALHPSPPPPPTHLQKTVYTFSSLPVLYALYYVLPVLIFCSATPVIFQIYSPAFYSRHFFFAVFILLQLYCLYCTDEGPCIVAETFDPNLRTIWLLFGWCKSKKNWHWYTQPHRTLQKKLYSNDVTAVKRNTKPIQLVKWVYIRVNHHYLSPLCILVSTITLTSQHSTDMYTYVTTLASS